MEWPNRSITSSLRPDTARRSECFRTRLVLTAAVSRHVVSASSAPIVRISTSWVTTTMRAAGCATSLETRGLPGRLLRADDVIPAEREQESGDHGMKNDRYGAPKPSLIRPAPHANDVAQDHPSEIDVANPEQCVAQSRAARLNRETRAAGDVERDPDHQRHDDRLAEEQDGIRKQAGLPLVHRRQPARGAHHNHNLTGDAEDQQECEQPEEETRTHQPRAGTDRRRLRRARCPWTDGSTCRGWRQPRRARPLPPAS